MIRHLRVPPSNPTDVEICFDFKPDTGVVTNKVVGDISEHDVLMPNLLRTQPTLCPVFDLLLLFSPENEDKVFNHDFIAAGDQSGCVLLRSAATPVRETIVLILLSVLLAPTIRIDGAPFDNDLLEGLKLPAEQPTDIPAFMTVETPIAIESL
ncbi:hypothetical protein Tco_1102560 [Tanacetum coccineum]